MTGDDLVIPDGDCFRGKGILVTGASGYLACALVQLLKDTDCRIVRLGRTGSPREPVAGRARIEERYGDLRDPELWPELLPGIDLVFHFAAQTSAYAANADPVADQQSNVLPLLHLLEACRRQGGCPTICFASTVTVAGIPARLPVDETHSDHPLTVYDLHKQMAEQYLRWYSEQGVVRGVTLRLANLYGPGPRASNSDRGVLNQMMARALKGEPLTLYGAGEQLRDYVYVEDAARAFLAAAARGAELAGRHFVIGSGQGHSIAQALQLVAERVRLKTGRTVELLQVEPPGTLSPIEQRNFVADCRSFTGATGWQPRWELSRGIDRTLEALS